jgi:hypothetical protein
MGICLSGLLPVNRCPPDANPTALLKLSMTIIRYQLSIVNHESQIENHRTAAWAAASLAIGTRNGEHET